MNFLSGAASILGSMARAVAENTTVTVTLNLPVEIENPVVTSLKRNPSPQRADLEACCNRIAQYILQNLYYVKVKKGESVITPTLQLFQVIFVYNEHMDIIDCQITSENKYTDIFTWALTYETYQKLGKNMKNGASEMMLGDYIRCEEGILNDVHAPGKLSFLPHHNEHPLLAETVKRAINKVEEERNSLTAKIMEIFK